MTHVPYNGAGPALNDLPGAQGNKYLAIIRQSGVKPE